MARIEIGHPIDYVCTFCDQTHQASAPKLFRHAKGWFVPVVRGHCPTTGHTVFQLGNPIPTKQAIKL